jgi:hypothetical protein
LYFELEGTDADSFIKPDNLTFTVLKEGDIITTGDLEIAEPMNVGAHDVLLQATAPDAGYIYWTVLPFDRSEPECVDIKNAAIANNEDEYKQRRRLEILRDWENDVRLAY